MKTLGILTTLSGNLIVFNGGIILFGKDEERDRYFPGARIACARFKGKDKSTFIDRQDMQGTVMEAVEQAVNFIQRNARLSSQIHSLHRQDTLEYPETALREVLVNATAHAEFIVGLHSSRHFR